MQCLARTAFDLVLLDIVMPDMNGHQLMGHINSQTPETLVIILTGRASVESAIESLRRGAYDYLRKPFEPEELLTTVENALERKRAEEALRKSEEKYRSLFEDSRDAVVITNREGKLVDVNQAWLDLYGYTRGEIADLNVGQLYASPDDQSRFQEGIEQKGFVRDYEFKARKKDETEMDCLITATVRRVDDESILGYQGIIRDITEKKRLEAQFQQAQKMQAMGTLAGGIAHDFNNLLMGIQGNASLALLDKTSTHPDYERLKNIEQSVKSGVELTKQLLGFVRAGRYEVRSTDLNELIRRSSNMFARTKKEITIHIRYQERIWPVEIDQGQIEQVLLNLYVNAWQAMPGGGELYLETENVTLKKKYVKPFDLKPGRYVKISIADTGIGMDKATQQRIFDPFFTTKEMGRGTGLGLASVYGIIKNHGGIINVYSEKGEGSTFTIYLAASEKEVIKEEELPEEVLRGEETVLLVDDEDVIIDVGEEILRELGYNVLIARGGKEAVEIYSRNKDKIDIVILDVIMPEMGGGETYDRMKKMNPDIKVLLLSGYSIDGQAEEILQRGCNGFIQKPFNVSKLSQTMREILDQK
jgi:PAS domain S-box-containing protein